ncbi:MAG TPA: bifunctional [glutamate--ammonia ligase]-adenylyl-L-tyrosine phosphorylase/[glutamate--ammonia-ligase] adenylyltransferase, partial [Thermodesulfovibrionales bacterium]|nr:bifunctional [glutamate--ammonia ligase]-adenylyl-L-tyrosine phosphorylase/[glutamate--ammonia-ligase] adenylyltransferase [Thermodesulfovibrionales bacterium]
SQVSLLFSISQFLSRFASSYPDVLFESLRTLSDNATSEALGAALRAALQGARQSLDDLMDIVRVFKKKVLLRLILRDVLTITDIVEATRELSILADVIVEESVRTLREWLRETYGEPNDNAFSVISVGKLGGNELNFSSDIDLLYVYTAEQGETSGIMTSGGVIKNRISAHEYYCKLGEQLGRFLSLNTGNGLAYRVDLRLRPGGQRGSIAQSLAAYEIYYESWGMAWERAVLLRARPTGGDKDLGRSFIEMIRPFVYRKYLDFSAIEEIRRMKTKIDAAFKKDDIKRGHGGIREIEFFVQAIQLIYAGKEPLLREGNILTALHRLLQKNLVGHGDYSVLNDNYLFLRKLEHRLQQLNDLQTHSLPSDGDELASLGRKMGFHDSGPFISSLEERRRMVRSVYDSLFAVKGEGISQETPGTSVFFDEDISTGELRQELSRYHLNDTEKAMRNIMHIRDATRAFQTIRGRRLLDEILPAFVLEALKTRNPDTALNNLQSFASLLASEEAYLELFTKNKTLVPTLARIFSMSEYLSKTIIKRPEYLELVGHEIFFRKSLASLKDELRGRAASGTPLPDSIRMLRQMEEIRLGTLFLEKKIDAVMLVKGLSRTAEAVVSLCADELQKNGLSIIGMGKAGGRELTFDSDLDLIFVSREEPEDSHIRAAERLIRLLTSYTKDGVAYRVDVRLRPDGTRGPLTSSLKALEQYYSSAAHFWEFQALLKARPLSGETAIGCSFMEMRKEILRKKGSEVSASDIRTMRDRIRRELSREKEGYDLKLGPGGIEELEFTVQFLQLTACHRYGGLLVQGSLDAIKRLAAAGMIDKGEADGLRETYIFYRTLESFLRLRGETVFRKGGVGAQDASDFMGFSGSGLPDRLEESRELVQGIFRKYLH